MSLFDFFKRRPKHTEEDTFKALQGYSFEDVRRALVKEYANQTSILSMASYMLLPNSDLKRIDKWQKARDKVLQKHGWTHAEYVSEFLRRAESGVIIDLGTGAP